MLNFSLSIQYGARRFAKLKSRGAKKNRRACRRFFRNSCSLNALTPLSIRRRIEMPKEVEIKLRREHG
jgi:hypothetical protein